MQGHSGFSRTHKIDNIGIIDNFVLPYFAVPSLVLPYDISNNDIRNLWVKADCISTGIVKKNLAILAFLYCAEFVKNLTAHKCPIYFVLSSQLSVLSFK